MASEESESGKVTVDMAEEIEIKLPAEGMANIPETEEVIPFQEQVDDPRPSRLSDEINAVDVSNACKAYGSGAPILRELNMEVQQGSIYSLLGSSGCGKTTLLTCIVGIRHLDSGSIHVFGTAPNPGPHIGYMPQEYALYPDLTLTETLGYYGQVYGIPNDKLKERSKFLIEFLQFPPKAEHRKVSNLSGGQKRRVSLAIAMLHEPKLLILDEPTVGVDHLLREKIWDLLKELVTLNKATVIITTHYIEESRSSDRIGFMRSGRLLCEDSPTALLEKYGTTLLEDVVLQLSKRDENAEDALEPNEETGKRRTKHRLLGIGGGPRRSPFKFSRFFALWRKNTLHMLRNYMFLLFNFLLPSIQIIVACWTMGIDPHDVQWGVVNNEVPLSQCTHGMTYSCNPPEKFSCIFYLNIADFSHNFGKALEIKEYKTEADAEADGNAGHIWGYLTIPKNFSTSLQDRYLAGPNVTDEILNSSKVTIHMDHSSDPMNGLINKLMADSFTNFTDTVLGLCGINKKVGELPLEYGKPIFSTRNSNFRDYFAPGILLANLFFLPLSASGISFISERKAGTLERSLVAGITTLEIIVTNTVSQFFVLTAQSIFSLFTMTSLFDIKVEGDLTLAWGLCVLTGISGMSLGFLISSIVEDEVQAVIIAVGSFFPNFALAGIVWPREAMPAPLQYLSYLLPCSLASEAMRSIISRGVGFYHIKVWPGFVTTFGWIMVYYGLTITVQAISARRR